LKNPYPRKPIQTKLTVTAAASPALAKRLCTLNEGKGEIFQEAKSNGFDVKVIREIVRL